MSEEIDLDLLVPFCQAALICDMCSGGDDVKFVPEFDKFICKTDRAMLVRLRMSSDPDQPPSDPAR